MRKTQSNINAILISAMLVGWLYVTIKYFHLIYCMFKASADISYIGLATVVCSLIALCVLCICVLLMKLNQYIHDKLRGSRL